MVDPIGSKPSVPIDRRIAPVASSAPVSAAQPATQDVAVRADPSTLRALAQPLAATPPVDADRVAKVRKAIQDGNFPLLPTTVADRLLALKMQWAPHGGSDDAS
ncbi:flagellar biosynthesis anti-sigma factor FlgM [Sphingomonas cannabina]|uniref:flagellar biosynthesis anti-sigma factor FlgM n=1 Tax=Sphingomonas cannabina TaxID=2899123 RepID=UPI001F2FE042|nr:flagellar biosynthesis anti-sigma factor FlgM [Sphingomonas cannabina]UIJ45449.1 flagellar biosynthesis anti-sigma factor FlgM [Sphingomonas cannabina]